MNESNPRAGLPWGTVLAVGVLTGILVLFQGTTQAGLPAVWPVLGMGMAAFLVLRWTQNYLWGMVAGLAVALHPVIWEWAGHFEEDRYRNAVLAATVELIVLASVIAAWWLVFQPRFTWRSWLVGVLVLSGGIGLAWPLEPRTGLVAAAITCVGLLLGAILAIGFHPRWRSDAPSWLNIAAAVVIGLGAPAAGLLLGGRCLQYFGWQPNAALPADGTWWDTWLAVVDSRFDLQHAHGFSSAELHQWCWPGPWVVLALAGWGLWRTFTRGWKLWARRRPPRAWVLSLYTALVLVAVPFHTRADAETPVLTLVTLATILAVFGVADVVRGFMERLVLEPPEERLREENAPAKKLA